MNAPLRKVGVVVMVLFALLFVNLNWVQAFKSKEYAKHENNGRVQVAEYDRQRGTILAGRNREALANSVETDGTLKYLRRYPFDERYAHVVGYKTVNLGETAVESYEDDFLAGTSDKLFVDRVLDAFTGKKTAGGNVLLTLSPAAQEMAVKQLANNQPGARSGAVVALDPKTGAVLAMASMPSFDPNPLVSHDAAAAEKRSRELNDDPRKPLLNRATSEVYAPGSTFKVIMSAAALKKGLTPDTTLRGGGAYQAPGTSHVIRNAPGVVCPEQISLKQALTVSCNTAFSRLAADPEDGLGGEAVKAAARDFGFGDSELRVGHLTEGGTLVVPSQTGELRDPDGSDDLPQLAQAAIGQSTVAMTPLQGAMIAAAVANDGVQMRPYVVEQLQGPDLTTNHYTASPRQLRRSVDDNVARSLQDMMVSVVENGTGRNAQIGGFRVGGKTGTAETASGDDHGWFIGFVMKGDDPIAAVAVLLENAGSGGSSAATGIAGKVMEAIIKDRGAN